MALSSIGVKFKGVISKDQDLLEAAKNGNVETIRKITTKKRQSTTSQFLPSFLKGSVNINCADREGYTPLHLATLNGHKGTVECLLSLEASVSIKDNSGCTPLHLAAWKGYEEICTLFLTFSNSSIPIDLQNSLGDTALHMAAQYGYSSVVSVLLQYNADSTIRNLKDESALDLAAQYGKLDVVQLLVTKNPDLVKHTVMSHSPLHLAAACGHVEIISTLLDAGFDINTKTNIGTALHKAAIYCKIEVVRILVESGIDIHALDSEGKTALEIILRNDQTQHQYASIAKFIRDHIMKSDTKEDTCTSKYDDGNVYDTSFDVKSAIPPPAPIVYDQLDSGKIDETKDTEIKTRPSPKPRLSLGETEEERKSALYAKANKDRSKMRNEESPTSVDSLSPKVPPRASFAFTQEITRSREAIAEEQHFNPPNLPKKERDSIPPLPPKTDDIPLLPPKVMSPTTDMVVADLPPVRIKSQEILDAPPPCDGGTVEPAHSGGYFMMTEGTSLSPVSQKKKPVKPPRKKSPAPARKNELSPVKHEELDSAKEDYETMANVKKSESDTSFSEDVYKTLFSNIKTEKSDTKNSCDAIPADNVPYDPEYTNISATADFLSKEKHSADPVSVPFTKYSKEKSEAIQTPDSNLTETAEDIYQNIYISRDEHSSLSVRSSTGFQRSGTESGGEEQNRHLPSFAESESDKRVSEKFDSESSSDRENKSISVTEKTCHSNGCDSNLDKNIPENKTVESNIPNEISKSGSDIPDESKTDIPNKNSIPNDNLQGESCIPCESLQNGSDSSSQGEKKLSEVRKQTSIDRDSFIPELPPKPGGDNESIANVLASEEKRISNGSNHVHDEPDLEEDLKTPKPQSLEFTKKRKSEHKFPMTPTGYPQPPTPDFPPPSPKTALKGIEQKISVIEMTSTKRSSRDIETETEDMNVKTEGDTSSTDKITDQSADVKTEDTAKDESESRSHDQPQEEQEEPVVMRRSSRLSSSGSGHEVLLGDELEPFAGLLRGSIAGGPRKVISQIYENVALSHKKTGAKRSSLPLGNMTFEPLMEREEDVGQSERIPSYEKKPVKISGMKEDGSFDDKDEWEQIADIVSSFGGKLSHDESMSAYDADISHLTEGSPFPQLMLLGGLAKAKLISCIVSSNTLGVANIKSNGFVSSKILQIADIMASFGAGIDRESVFVEKFEALFTKHLAGAGSNLPIHSVGEWLETLGLGQYENTLYANGFDDTDFLGEKIMEEPDLDSIGIIIADHRKKILDHAKLLPQINPISADTLPPSVESWLNSLRIPQYLDKFISHKFDTMERVLQLWELELTTVLDISSLGHRKRMLASLGDRSPQERHFTSLKKKSRVETNKNKSPFTDINLFKDYTKVKPLTSTSEDEVNKSSKPETPTIDSNDNDDVFQNNVQGKSIKDSSIHIRPPHQANTTTPIKQWRHRPEMLIKGCCNYTAQYLGSTLVKELTGTSSTIQGIAKLKKSADVIAKIPTIMLSISYRGVKFIDAKSKKVICDHEIVNIFCACQDAESMNFFAYITRDNETGKHYCHVFSVRTADLAREVIMTLGEAFEVAYQMAQKEKAAVEAQEFERTLSQSDAEDSSQSKSSSKASLNTV